MLPHLFKSVFLYLLNCNDYSRVIRAVNGCGDEDFSACFSRGFEFFDLCCIQIHRVRVGSSAEHDIGRICSPGNG